MSGDLARFYTTTNAQTYKVDAGKIAAADLLQIDALDKKGQLTEQKLLGILEPYGDEVFQPLGDWRNLPKPDGPRAPVNPEALYWTIMSQAVDEERERKKSAVKEAVAWQTVASVHMENAYNAAIRAADRNKTAGILQGTASIASGVAQGGATIKGGLDLRKSFKTSTEMSQAQKAHDSARTTDPATFGGPSKRAGELRAEIRELNATKARRSENLEQTKKTDKWKDTEKELTDLEGEFETLASTTPRTPQIEKRLADIKTQHAEKSKGHLRDVSEDPQWQEADKTLGKRQTELGNLHDKHMADLGQTITDTKMQADRQTQGVGVTTQAGNAVSGVLSGFINIGASTETAEGAKETAESQRTSTEMQIATTSKELAMESARNANDKGVMQGMKDVQQGIGSAMSAVVRA